MSEVYCSSQDVVEKYFPNLHQEKLSGNTKELSVEEKRVIEINNELREKGYNYFP